MKTRDDSTTITPPSAKHVRRQKRFSRLDLMPSVPETVSNAASKLRSSLLFQKPVEADPYGRTPSSSELYEASSDFSMLDMADALTGSPTQSSKRPGVDGGNIGLANSFASLDEDDVSRKEPEKDESKEPVTRKAGNDEIIPAHRNMLSRWQQSSGVF